MIKKIKLEDIFVASDVIVAREIEGELIIVPLISGIGDLEDELFTLNEIGKAIWGKLDGTRTLEMVVEELSSNYDVPKAQIKEDVRGFVQELVNRRILVEIE